MNEVLRAKAELRPKLARRAEQIPPDRRDAAEPRMRALALALPEIRDAKGVMVCLSFGTEPQTRALIEALQAEGKAVYLPRADRRDRQLHLHRWPCELRTLSFGLDQPTRASPQLAAEEIETKVDVAIILGLGFDASGIRLGHGSGYVDRFLTAHPLPAIGLSFETLVVPTLPRATYDVPMTALVSEDRVLRPAADPREALREWLSLDHREIDRQLNEALAGAGFDPSAFARFRERLLRHIGIEERLLFPAVRSRDPEREAQRLANLRIEHAALTTLLVPTPDRALAAEIQTLLVGHNESEEGPEGVYASCIAALHDDDARQLLHAARARRPVPTTSYFDGQATVRTAAEALAKARRSRR
ncbi:5-formyltetrahydrofolate cyclo-ligase family protein [Enhygromyxa salina]|uniref:5-formyltetrahydrofolate cyclo-ligase family protein n=1 Tax=Enhygromyxa salina TaxID=215803 RepID=A0A2S9XK33_9BACT|nr:5-formyltetrahydrofolate cyclo-ligase [Enhygromyxa salina]PRP93213.1 5-formyltetrahydrofolate cyclo-ligase family protein [Enhygromyxa salina]